MIRLTKIISALPADAGVAPYERIVVIPRDTFLAAVKDLPSQAPRPARVPFLPDAPAVATCATLAVVIALPHREATPLPPHHETRPAFDHRT
jgi:hypothetical protein